MTAIRGSILTKEMAICHKAAMELELRKTLLQGASELGLSLAPEALDLFVLYHRELLLWNRRINLVSEKSSQEIVTRHFLDSLTVAPWIEHPNGPAIDLGSGAGFPGVPLAIALPQFYVTLVEASRKKSSFLLHIQRTLRLERLSVIRERIEVLYGEKRCSGLFDMVLSRAAFKLPELIRIAAFFLKPGGLLIALKGLDSQGEMAEAEAVLADVGMTRETCRDVSLTFSKHYRKIMTYRRIS